MSNPLGDLSARPAWRFFRAFTLAVPGFASLWWILLALRAIVPPALAVVTAMLVGAVQRGEGISGAIVAFGIVFVLAQTLPPLHQTIGTLAGHRFSAVLYERLMATTLEPQGIGHLERGDVTNDLVTARDFDTGWTGPPMYLNMDFISSGLVTLFSGILSAFLLVGLAWWAPLLLLAAWGSTHWLLRESGVWRDRNTDEVKTARRHTNYAYDLATEPGPAKEVRQFCLSSWILDRFTTNRLRLHELQYRATKLREKSLIGALLIVLAANLFIVWFIVQRALGDAGTAISLQSAITYAGGIMGASAIAFGGLTWALDGAAAPVVSIEKLEPEMRAAGRLTAPDMARVPVPPGAPTIEFRDVTFTYPTGSRPVLENFSLSIPAGRSIAIVGQNGAGKTTIAKLLCRLYDPQQGSIAIDGVDLRDLVVGQWRADVAAVFQDFVRYELPLRDNVAPLDGSDAAALRALRAAGADQLASLDTPLAKGYPGGIDLSGGQWQRVALARAIAKVEAGAGVVLLDEPTAMLDVRGESEIFRRILEATRSVTTILVSHRFSTVRLADLICVVEHGQVIEYGTHDELMALGGRYAHMYTLQASRFVEHDEQGEVIVHDVL